MAEEQAPTQVDPAASLPCLVALPPRLVVCTWGPSGPSSVRAELVLDWEGQPAKEVPLSLTPTPHPPQGPNRTGATGSLPRRPACDSDYRAELVLLLLPR
jgi:hypothetical protein